MQWGLKVEQVFIVKVSETCFTGALAPLHVNNTWVYQETYRATPPSIVTAAAAVVWSCDRCISDTTIQHRIGPRSRSHSPLPAPRSRYGGRRKIPVTIRSGRQCSWKRQRRSISRCSALQPAQQATGWVSVVLSLLHPVSVSYVTLFGLACQLSFYSDRKGACHDCACAGYNVNLRSIYLWLSPSGGICCSAIIAGSSDWWESALC